MRRACGQARAPWSRVSCLPACCCCGYAAPWVAELPGRLRMGPVPSVLPPLGPLQACTAMVEAWARHRRQFRAVWDAVSDGLEGKEVGLGGFGVPRAVCPLAPPPDPPPSHPPTHPRTHTHAHTHT